MSTSRRDLFRVGAAAFTAASYGRILGANGRVRLGALGTGHRCRYLMEILARRKDIEFVTVCDAYQPFAEEAIAKSANNANAVQDFRRILDDQSIDAVVIGAPDHWHVPMTTQAVAAGKDVYVEKPVTHSIEEGAVLQKAVDSSKKIVQTGMQQRSWEHFREARDLIRSGGLGQVTLIRTYWYQNYLKGRGNYPEVDMSKLDWNAWLGSAPQQPFRPERFYRWRWYWDFGGGTMTDLFTHWVDVAHWFMDKDTPTGVQAIGGLYALDWECPDTVSASYRYPANTLVTYDSTLIGSIDDGGLVVRGSKGTMRINRSGYSVYSEDAPQIKGTYQPEARLVSHSEHDGTIDHLANWLDCVRSRQQPNAPVSVGIAAARASHMGNKVLRATPML